MSEENASLPVEEQAIQGAPQEGASAVSEPEVPVEVPEDITKPKAQQRFKDLVAKVSHYRQEAEAARSELAELKKPKLEDFNHDIEQFSEAQTEYTIATRTAAKAESHAQEEETRAQEELLRHWGTIKAKAVEDYPDFTRVFTDDLPVSRTMAEAIMAVDNPADVAYFLGTRRDVAANLAAMPPHLAGMEIARIEARLATAPLQTKTPRPPAIAVTGAGAGGVKSYDDMSIDEFMERRRQEISARKPTY
jgi:hypothetical protein